MEAAIYKPTGTDLAEQPTLSRWDRLPDKKKLAAQKWVPLLSFLVGKSQHEGSTVSAVVEWFLLVHDSGSYPKQHAEALKLGRKGKPPSRATLIAKCGAYRDRGVIGLVPNHKGSQRTVYGWEVRALHYWQMPSQLSYKAVAEWLAEEGHDKEPNQATYERVRSYIKSLPADIRKKGRMGPRLFENSQKNFVRRSTEALAPGAVYQGDGNTVDIYMRHPKGGARAPWRAELTVWLDVASRTVVGWYLSNAESGNSTLFSLSDALLTHDHIPSMLHIDNGSGFKNKMMSDEAHGFYARLGITVHHSLPYNAKGKGHVERFFKTFQHKFLKRFESYCGADMDNEAAQKIQKGHKDGTIQLPTREEFAERFTTWLETYHKTPHRGLDGQTPAQVWANLDRKPVGEIGPAIFWPRAKCTVLRSAIRYKNREYGANTLLQYNDQRVIIEYSLKDDRTIRVLDMHGRWICDANLISKKAYMPQSRIDEAELIAARAASKRLDVKQEETQRRAGLSITHEQLQDNNTIAATHYDPIDDHSDQLNPLDQIFNPSNIDIGELFND